MTDKVQKIKEWISNTQDGLMDAQGNFEYPEHEGAYHILCNLDAYIDSMQDGPTIPDIVDEHWWEMLGEEPVSEELEKEMESFFIKMQVQENENIFEDTFKNIARHFAKWQKQKDAEALNENALLYNARLEGIEIGKAEGKRHY